MSVDGTDTNGYDAANNPQPYAIADQYNNAMRYYDELALFQARKRANVNEEMTWRLLMDDMYMNPQNYVNALIINLHGELMPFAPTRNYSDAAKSPGQTFAPDLRSMRAVVHSEQLRYTNADAVTLRVYTYLADPTVVTPAPVGIMPVPLTIRINGLNGWVPANAVGCSLTATCNIQVIHGGVDNDSAGGVDVYDGAPVPAAAYPVAGQANQMAWTSSVDPVTNDTVLKLYGSPLTTPIEPATGRGLAAQDRLYGLEYIPSPVEDLTTAAVQFSTDLSSTAMRPKNTARWIIKIPLAAFPVAAANTGEVLSIETRIGDQETSGYLYPAAVDPENKSRTFVWRGDDTYIFGNAATSPKLPVSERFQVLGDPRHCPYADLKRPHIANAFPPAAIVGPPAVPQGGYESALGMGYNRYFDNFEDGTRNRGAWPEWTGTLAETFNIVSAGTINNRFSIKINGGASISVTLANGGARTAAGIAGELNADGTFSASAIAESVGGHLRIIAKTVGTIQFDKSTSSRAECARTLGFDDAIHSDEAWTGWFYTVAGQQYGIKNDGAAGLGTAGWNSGSGTLEIDVHRMFQMLRSALTRSNAIWTTMTGFSYYYIGIGNEIGYDSANGFASSIPVSTKPFTGASGSRYEDSILGTVKVIRENNGGTSWWALPWIGELYPDAVYATWLASGNIPTGVGANQFIRTDRINFPTFPGTKLTDGKRRTAAPGCTTLFWTGTPASTFHHESHNGDQATITAAGTDIADHFALPVPITIDNARPFDINFSAAGSNPENFLQPGDYPTVYLTKVLNTYYTHSGAPVQASALVSLTDPVTNNPAFIAVNGLSPTGVSGTTFIAKWSFLTLIQSYLNGGLYTDATAQPTAKHIRQVPRVLITDPNENTDLKQKSSITIGWSTTWKRWDGQNYTIDPLYATWFETLTMKYAVLYSPSNGYPDPKNANPTGWFYVSDNTVATPGVKPNVAHEVSQVIAGATTTNSVTWNTPSATFPQGSYLIRIEGYRDTWPLHYSFHQYRAFFQR